jgi:serine/threonine protein kinase
MATVLLFRDDLVQNLPLPLARLYRRTYNSIDPLKQHQAAIYLWEATIKLISSAAVVEFAAQSDKDKALQEMLRALARPTLGQWCGFARHLIPVLAENDPAFRKAHDFLFQESRTTSVSELYRGIHSALEGKQGANRAVSIAQLFDILVTYRNKRVGHGALASRPKQEHETMSRLFLLAAMEVLGSNNLDVLAGRRLVYIARVEKVRGCVRFWPFELAGEAAKLCNYVDLPDSAGRLPNPQSVYLANGDVSADLWSMGKMRSLHPLLMYDDASNEVFFLNARQGKKGVEYLCYETGNNAKETNLLTEQRSVMEWILDRPINPADFQQWAEATLQDEEPAEERWEEEETQTDCPTVGGFKLRTILGKGATGVVYRALQPSLGREVALKCQNRLGDPIAEQRFAREIRALGRLDHSNIVRIFDSGSDGEQFYYAMELVEGTDLGSVCKELSKTDASNVTSDTWRDALTTACEKTRRSEQKLGGDTAKATSPHKTSIKVPAGDSESPIIKGRHGDKTYLRNAVGLMRHVAEAVHCLHEGGVVHRDIKPSNIMVTTEPPFAVLADLGTAQIVDESQGHLTSEGEFIGTYRYASPEQILGAVSIDKRTDIYSLGATFWELLTLRPLLKSNGTTSLPDLLYHAQKADPAPPSLHNRSINRDLDTIVLKCLKRDRDQRYQSARELTEDLDLWMRGEMINARPHTFLYVLRNKLYRHRLPISISAAVFAILLCAFIVHYVVAQEGFRQARFAVGQLTELNDDRLEHVPGAQDAQREVSRKIRDYYQDFLPRGFLFGARRNEVALAHYRLGLATEKMEDPETALPHYEKARTIQEALRSKHPKDTEILRELGNTSNRMGRSYVKLSKYKEAIDAYEEAKKCRDAVANAPDATAQDRRLRANVNMNLGQVHMKVAELDIEQVGKTKEEEKVQPFADNAAAHLQEAEKYLTEAQSWRKQLLGQSLSDIDKRNVNRDKGQGELNLGILAFTTSKLNGVRKMDAAEQQDLATAEGHYREAVRIFEELLGDQPNEIQYQEELAKAYRHLADVYTQRKPPVVQAAFVNYQHAKELYESLVHRNPDVPAYEYGLAQVHMNLAPLQWAFKQYGAALYSLETARGTLEKLTKEDPDVTDYRQDYDRTVLQIQTWHGQVNLENIADSLRQLSLQSFQFGEINEAIKTLELAARYRALLTEKLPENPQYIYDYAATRQGLANLQLQYGQNDEAEENLKRSAELLTNLVDRNADNAGYRLHCAVVLKELATVEYSLGNIQSAKMRIVRSIEHLRTLAETLPANDQLRPTCAQVLQSLADYIQQIVGQSPEYQALSEQTQELLRRVTANSTSGP